MQRKVSKIGPSTLMVSLPTSWVKQHGIRKGDTVDVIEEGDKIILHAESPSSVVSSKTITVSGLKVMLNRVIGACYKKGYSEIKIVFDSHSQLAQLHEELQRSWTGMEVVEQGNSFIVLKQVSELKKEDFPSMLNRAFLFLVSTASEAEKAVSSGDQQALRMVSLRDPIQNRYCDFCRRVLNKMYIPGNTALYYLVEQLERIGDLYRDLCKHLMEHPLKIRKEHATALHDINLLLQQVYTLYYRFSLERFEEFGNYFYNLRERLQSFLRATQKKEEVFVLSLLCQINQSIFDMNGALLTTQL